MPHTYIPREIEKCMLRMATMLYFCDTGLACSLLNIHTEEQLPLPPSL